MGISEVAYYVMLVDDMHVSDGIRFKGKVPKYAKSVDLTVSTTHSEYSSLSLQESVHYGSKKIDYWLLF